MKSANFKEFRITSIAHFRQIEKIVVVPFLPLQVLIQETGERRHLGVGVVNGLHDGHGMPGWLQGTVGYHIDDGKVFDSTSRLVGKEVEGKNA